MIDSGPTSGVYGNPGPSLWEDTADASLIVAAVSGDPFTFTSIDLWGETADYTIEGVLNGVSVFTVSANVPDDNWLTLNSPSAVMIDILRVSVAKDQSEYSNVDNIRLNGPPVPEPASICLWAVLMAAACGLRGCWHRYEPSEGPGGESWMHLWARPCSSAIRSQSSGVGS